MCVKGIELTAASRIIRGRIAQLVRAPALHAGSRGFESLFAHVLLCLDPIGDVRGRSE